MVGLDWLWSEYVEIADDTILTLFDMFCNLQPAVDVYVEDTKANKSLVADTEADLHDVEQSDDDIGGARKF